MTTQTNKSVDNQTRNKAARMAIQRGENIVVYTTGENQEEKSVRFITTLSAWERSSPNSNITFIATIDKDGNYVD